MADKFPSISPYHYCHWNPINLIDSDGEKDQPFKHGIDKAKTYIENTSTPPILIFGGIKTEQNQIVLVYYFNSICDDDNRPRKGADKCWMEFVFENNQLKEIPKYYSIE